MNEPLSFRGGEEPQSGGGVGAVGKRGANIESPHPNPSPEEEGLKKVRFAGYAAIFGRIDRGGDIIRHGAFARSLARSGGKLPLLWQHRADRVIGQITYSEEDRRGLRVIGEITDAQFASPATKGLSFGYRVRQSKGSEPRELAELDLVEISLVRVPMMPLAQVHLVMPRDLPAAGFSYS